MNLQKCRKVTFSCLPAVEGINIFYECTRFTHLPVEHQKLVVSPKAICISTHNPVSQEIVSLRQNISFSRAIFSLKDRKAQIFKYCRGKSIFSLRRCQTGPGWPSKRFQGSFSEADKKQSSNCFILTRESLDGMCSTFRLTGNEVILGSR